MLDIVHDQPPFLSKSWGLGPAIMWLQPRRGRLLGVARQSVVVGVFAAATPPPSRIGISANHGAA